MPEQQQQPVYADGVAVNTSPFTIRIVFTVASPPTAGNQPPVLVADVCMSPQHAKVMAILLKKNLKNYEQSSGQSIDIHPQVAQQLGISPHEDW